MALLTEEDRQYLTPEDICAHLGDDYARFMGAIVRIVSRVKLRSMG